MLKHFRERYSFKVFFVNELGKVIIAEQGVNKLEQLSVLPEFKKIIPDIIGKEIQLFEYTQAGDSYLLTKKYIPELDLYLLVEAKVDNFTQSVREAFHFNMIVSLLITLLITIIVVLYVRKIHSKLSELASNDILTGLPNRRTFHRQLEHFLSLKVRNQQQLSLAFVDVDDFKMINDTQGHDVGDKILINIATTLKSNIRNSDFIARWGGEEFIILLIDTQLKDAKLIAEELRKKVENNTYLLEHAKKKVTVSIGVTQTIDKDDADSLFKRVDNYLYQAKMTGKNCVVTSEDITGNS
jgi:diguanylate cyclase (GGDEF)-like protein